MLSIEYNSGSNKKSVDWHVGDFAGSLNAIATHVTRLDATDRELEHLQRHFTGIPMVHNQKIVTWRGEIAQFIAANL